MALPHTVRSLDALHGAVRQHYVKQADGAYRLQTDDSPEMTKMRERVSSFTQTRQQAEHAASLRIAKANAERDAAVKNEKIARAQIALSELLALAGGDAAAINLIPPAEKDRLLVDGEPASREAMAAIVTEYRQLAPSLFRY
jgi:hypothetical protein